jgi:sugar lactone lactonase YvrE
MSSRFTSARRTLTHALLVILSGAVSACGGAGDAPSSGAEGQTDARAGDIVVADVGFATPESVLHDPGADVYLVSNINGSPLEEDHNGFISRVAPDGSVEELKWISGAERGVTLHAPKGMTIQDGTLYVADINCIRLFDAATGDPQGPVCLENATFLNDVAPGGDGSIFFTDSGFEAGEDGLTPSGSDAVYRLIDNDRVVAVAKDPALGGPNGITVGSRGILVASFGSGEVYRLDVEGNRADMMPVSERQFDGIVMLPDGGFLVSSWGDQAVYRIGGDGSVGKAMEDVEAAADIGYDASRNVLLVPLFMANQLVIHPLG